MMGNSQFKQNKHNKFVHNIQDMTKLLTIVLVFLAFATLGSARWSGQSHDYTPSVSAEIANQIKSKIIQKIPLLTAKDPTFANALKADLDQKDDSKRTLKQISTSNFEALCALLNVYVPSNKCDANKDGNINGDELKCLNWIWKSYLPA